MNTVKIFLSSLLLAFLVSACTITPTIKDGSQASFGDDGKRNSGLIYVIPEKGGVFDESARNRYNTDIALYPYGIESYRFSQKLEADFGVTAFQENGKTRYLFSPKAMEYFRVLNLARKNALPAYKL